MTVTAERLVELLPNVYGLRDGDRGPLHELLCVVADQLAVLEDSLDQLYDDQFVETSAAWVLPYLADLLGITGLPPAPLTPRAEVAHTIAYRRRKGTAAILEQLARDVTGLPTRAVEFFELLSATQHLNHLRPDCQSFVSVRDALLLESLGGPFERLPGRVTLTHTVDVRRIAAGRGRYNIPNVGVFLWPLPVQRLTRSPAVPTAPGEQSQFRFSPLGCDAPLFNRPHTEDELTHLAEPRNVPGRISRRAADADLSEFYGDDRSFLIEDAGTPVPLAEVTVCDLSDWAGADGRVSVDPVLGRIVFPWGSETPVVTFHYGFGANIGGGEYERSLTPDSEDITVVHPGSGPLGIQRAIDELPPAGGVVEITHSGRFEEPSLAIDASGRGVTVRAAPGVRPTVVLAGDVTITGNDRGFVMVDGLLVTGGAIQVEAPESGERGLGALGLRHTTLVPGVTLGADGLPETSRPSLVVRSPLTAVAIERSIVGGVRVDRDARVHVVDSIVDATAATGVAFAAAEDDDDFAGALSLEQVTVIGRVKADALDLVSNTILLAQLPDGADAEDWPGPVLARRRQNGCVRFSYVPPGSRTPRRHRCQPSGGDAARAEPVFASTRYGDPMYGRLAPASPRTIREGADDESELGAFHHLHRPRREAHLRTRLDEHLRFGLETGLLHAS